MEKSNNVLNKTPPVFFSLCKYFKFLTPYYQTQDPFPQFLKIRMFLDTVDKISIIYIVPRVTAFVITKIKPHP